MNGNKSPQGENSSNSTSRMPKLEGDVNQSSDELATLMNANKVLEKRNRDIEEANKRFAADLAAQANNFADLESVNKTLRINIMKLTEDQTTQTNKVTGLECKIKTLEGNVTLMISVLAMQSSKIVDLESKNKTLKGNVIKTNADLAMQTNKVVDLELKNKTLEDNVRKATADLAARDNTISDLESKTMTDFATQNKIVSHLETKINALEGSVTKLTADLAVRTNELEAIRQERYLQTRVGKEVWMNDDIESSHWVSVEVLLSLAWKVSSVFYLGTNCADDPFVSSPLNKTDPYTNVKPTYIHRVTLFGANGLPAAGGKIFKAVLMEDLVPNKQKARFRSGFWLSFICQGKTYVILGTD